MLGVRLIVEVEVEFAASETLLELNIQPGLGQLLVSDTSALKLLIDVKLIVAEVVEPRRTGDGDGVEAAIEKSGLVLVVQLSNLNEPIRVYHP